MNRRHTAGAVAAPRRAAAQVLVAGRVQVVVGVAFLEAAARPAVTRTRTEPPLKKAQPAGGRPCRDSERRASGPVASRRALPWRAESCQPAARHLGAPRVVRDGGRLVLGQGAIEALPQDKAPPLGRALCGPEATYGPPVDCAPASGLGARRARLREGARSGVEHEAAPADDGEVRQREMHLGGGGGGVSRGARAPSDGEGVQRHARGPSSSA